MTQSYHALALYSGGLDSILAMKTVLDQGLRVLGLHFCSPFFGHPDKIGHWQRIYNLEIRPVDVHQEFIDILRQGPRFGYGKVLNPCVDCKITMLSHAKSLLDQYGARFLISGEVLGQRPMSQRRDTLNLISKQADVRDLLLRPLCAGHLPSTPMEEEGLVDRSRLHSISGRGRKDQLRLAETYGLTEIPTPAGGCLLAEQESAKRFWPVLTRIPEPSPRDFALANMSRQYWNDGLWMMVGRNKANNDALARMAQAEDLLFKTADVQGPLALGRRKPGIIWTEEDIRRAATFVAGFTAKKRPPGQTPLVRVASSGQSRTLECPAESPSETGWTEFTWDRTKQEKQDWINANSPS
ncbi:adenine nucleotide alpha hydrolase family protein [Desulfonatronum thiodismutans]|uniref:tRNA (5-methylaminomethyl-2-thiouridylate)-methyltransferase n=1 Tax=Desulfonatronum thiodismutans TaxID=159290 RepID=UPI0004ABE8D5|nr:tRNA (5-methylaminomethyl-2-thiouridylate)-methyltransferase [Desulfonatronum thiodismutans]